jgi:tetratricopeptide (TPR) repeat protein
VPSFVVGIFKLILLLFGFERFVMAASWGFRQAIDFAVKNVSIILKGSGLSVATVSAKYCFEASRLNTDITEARSATSRGRQAYVQGRTLAARDDMNTAKCSIEMAHKKLENGLLSWCAEPALWWAKLSRPSLDAYTAHIYYHCAVLQIHSRHLDAAIELLDKACKLRRVGAAVNNLEYARSITRRGDIESLTNVAFAKKAYEEAIKIADDETSFFSARARNNFGILWHALGFDEEACRYFKAAAESADDVSAPTVETCNKLAQSSTALEQLRKLGRGTVNGGSATKLDDGISDLLKKTRCGVVDVDFLQANEAPQRELELAERLKLSWRKRVTARTNLLNVIVTSEQSSAQDIEALLDEICGTKSRVAAGGRTTVLFHPAYCAIDCDWLAGGGKVRIATSIAAGLTELLRQNYFTDEYERVRAVQLAQSAFALVKAQVHSASSTHQGIYQYHFAKFELKNGGQIEVIDRFISQAIINHGGGAGQRVPSQRDARLLAEALLLQGTAHSEISARTTLDIVQHTLANGAMRDTKMQNSDHPVLLRATSRLRGGDALPTSYAHTCGTDCILGSIESTIKVLSSDGLALPIRH